MHAQPDSRIWLTTKVGECCVGAWHSRASSGWLQSSQVWLTRKVGGCPDRGLAARRVPGFPCWVHNWLAGWAGASRNKLIGCNNAPGMPCKKRGCSSPLLLSANHASILKQLLQGGDVYYVDGSGEGQFAPVRCARRAG